MPRWSKLDNWPGKLDAFTVAQLREERAYWQQRLELSRLASSRKEMAKRVRLIDKLIAARGGAAT